MASVNPTRQACFSCSSLLRLPCTLVKKVWELAVRISHFVLGTRNPLVYTDAEQREIDRLITLFRSPAASTLAGRVTTAARSPITMETLGKPTELTKQPPATRSQELIRFQILVKQIATVAGYLYLSEKIGMVQNTEGWNATLAMIGRVTDIFSDRVATLIENLSFPELFDRIFDYTLQETNAHKAASQGPYKAEAARVEHAKKLVADYEKPATIPPSAPTVTKAAYNEAKLFLIEKASIGAELLLQEIFYQKYIEALKSSNNCIFAAEAAKVARQTKATEWVTDFNNLPPDQFEEYLRLYLQHIYLRTFVEEPGCPKEIKELTTSMSCIDTEGTAQFAYRERVLEVSQKLIHEMLPHIKPAIDQINEGNEFLTQKTILDILRSILSGTLGEVLAPVLEKYILPGALSYELVDKVFPALQDQLLRTICKAIVETKWTQFGPLLFRYIVCQNLSEKADLTKRIKEGLWIEMQSPERQTLSLAGDNPPFSRDRFDGVVDDLLAACSKQQLVMSKVLTTMSTTDAAFYPIVDKFFTLLSADQATKVRLHAEIKTLLLQGIPEEVKGTVPLTEQQILAYSNHVSALIEKIEKRLLALKAGAAENLLDLEAVERGIRDVLADVPLEVNQTIGDIAISIGFDIGNAAPWASTILRWTFMGSLKGAINSSVSGAMEPTRESHHELMTTMTDSLQDKLCDADGRVNTEKVRKMFFLPPEPCTTTEAEALSLLAREVFELAMVVPPKFGYGDRVKGLLKSAVLGNDATHLEGVINKVHKTFLGHRLINLARVQRISDIVLTAINAASEKADAAVPAPAPALVTA